MPRNGKIARLPRALLEELNQRLDDGEARLVLLSWLNDRDDVRSLLATHFGGRPITEMNMSAWARGGFLEWKANRQASKDIQNMSVATFAGAKADDLAGLITARYAAALQQWDGELDSPAARQMRAMNPVIREIAALRRSDHSAGNILIKQHRLDLEIRKSEERRDDVLKERARIEENRERTSAPENGTARDKRFSDLHEAIMERSRQFEREHYAYINSGKDGYGI